MDHRIGGRATFGVVVLTAAVLAACGTTASAPAPTPTTAVVAGMTPGSTYVALGSSFAAAGPPPNSPPPCGRSGSDYPQRMAAALRLHLTDVSCDGATTDDILRVGQGTYPPQITAVTRSTALVTITIGGNDIDYLASAFTCSATYTTGGCSATVDENTLGPLVARLPAQLVATIQAVAAAAPRARIVLVTYPRIVPAAPVTCPALHLTASDAAALSWLGQHLEDASVAAAREEHILLADPYVLGAGHSMCAPAGQAWVFGHTVTVRPPTGNLPYHPTDAGRAEMAGLVEQALAG